jgi:hypothetical protein
MLKGSDKMHLIGPKDQVKNGTRDPCGPWQGLFTAGFTPVWSVFRASSSFEKKPHLG